MNNKTKEHIEDLYETIKNEREINNSTFNIIKIQKNIINLLEDDIKSLRYKLKHTIDRELEAKDYEYYKGGMVKIVKLKDKEIESLKLDNQKLRDTIIGLESQIELMTRRIRDRYV
jgi:hypothetical protein